VKGDIAKGQKVEKNNVEGINDQKRGNQLSLTKKKTVLPSTSSFFFLLFFSFCNRAPFCLRTDGCINRVVEELLRVLKVMKRIKSCKPFEPLVVYIIFAVFFERYYYFFSYSFVQLNNLSAEYVEFDPATKQVVEHR